VDLDNNQLLDFQTLMTEIVFGLLKQPQAIFVKEGKVLLSYLCSSQILKIVILYREPVPCGSLIRLKHANTQGYLHSHLHQSPLSRQQEVSCYDGKDNGDNWKVECLQSGDKTWIRENTIQLVHENTYAYLSSFANHQFGHPIPGQLEVAASRSASKNSQWMAQVRTQLYRL
jgi:dolichyl-phosphate-mannose--protein O-mannosyl transferase